MTTVAVLDANGVLAGYERALPDDYEPKANEVIVPDECDLLPGKYVWGASANAGNGTFIPITRGGSADEAKQVNVLRAIFRGFQAIESRFPGTIPTETKDWMTQFASSVDNKGAN
jgi:hypothetical protein